MAERTITQADGLAMVATGLLAIALLVAGIFIFTGLTTPPPPLAVEESAAAPAADTPAEPAPAVEAPAAN